MSRWIALVLALVLLCIPAFASYQNAPPIQAGSAIGQILYWNGLNWIVLPGVVVDSSGDIAGAAISGSSYSVGGTAGVTYNVYTPNGGQLQTTNGIVVTGKAPSIVPITGAYTVTQSNGMTGLCSPGTYTITLPPAASYPNRFYAYVVNGVMSSNTITITSPNGNFTTGSASITMTTSNCSRILESNGTNWFIWGGIN